MTIDNGSDIRFQRPDEGHEPPTEAELGKLVSLFDALWLGNQDKNAAIRGGYRSQSDGHTARYDIRLDPFTFESTILYYDADRQSPIVEHVSEGPKYGHPGIVERWTNMFDLSGEHFGGQKEEVGIVDAAGTIVWMTVVEEDNIMQLTAEECRKLQTGLSHIQRAAMAEPERSGKPKRFMDKLARWIIGA